MIRIIYTILVLMVSLKANGQQRIIDLGFLDKDISLSQISEVDLNGNILSQTAFQPLYIADQPVGITMLNDKYYGTSENGDTGLIYEYNLQSNDIQTYTAPSGVRPNTSLIAVGDSLFGIAESVIFSYNPTTKDFRTLFDVQTFTRNPLTLAGNGKLYGSCENGGANNRGFIFEFDPATSTYTVVYDFLPSDEGYQPEFSLVEGDNNKLYGVSRRDNPFLFSFNYQTGVYKLEINGGLSNIGENVVAAPTVGPDGKVYVGLSRFDGQRSPGGYLQYDPVTEIIENTFELPEGFGENSRSPLSFANSTVALATSGIGEGEYQLFYTLDVQNGSFTKIDSLSLVNGLENQFIAVSENKYITLAGNAGFESAGGIVELDLNNASVNILQYTTNFPSGRKPRSNPIQTSDGRILGLANGGSELGGSVIYEYNTALDSILLVADLGAQGFADARSQLIEGPNGYLYGLSFYTEDGFNFLGNTLFRVKSLTNEVDTLYTFGNDELFRSPGQYLQIKDGYLYGFVRVYNGSNFGGFYRINLDTGVFEPYFALDLNTGFGVTSFVFYQDYLLAFMRQGGANGQGTIFFLRLSNKTSNEIALDHNDIRSFRSNVLVHSNGNAYAYGNAGGSTNQGGLLELNLNDEFRNEYSTDYSGDSGSALKELPNENIVGQYNITNTNDHGIFTFDTNTKAFSALTAEDALDGETSSITTFCIKPNIATGIRNESFFACPGDLFTVDLATDNTDTITWTKDGNALNKTDDILTFTAISSTDAGDYEVELLNSCGSRIIQFSISVSDLAIEAIQNDTQVVLTASGGTAPYKYSVDGTNFQTDSTFTLPNGQYTFTVRDANGCEVTTSEAVAVTSVEFKSGNVLFYPNPVEDIINVSSMEGSWIRIIDNRGVTFFQKEISEVDEQVSLRFLNPGIYLFEVVKRAGEVQHFKLLKE